jgi:hypothetical protein
MVILDDTSAARFDDATPRGRYIYKRGLDRNELQAPYITAGQIREIVRAARNGESQDPDAARVSPEDIFKVALTLDGAFSLRSLYKILEGKASKRYLERLGQEYEGQIIEIDGDPYELQPASGNNPRMLVPAITTGSPLSENDRDTGRDTENEGQNGD